MTPSPRRRSLSRFCDCDVVEGIYSVLNVARRSIFLLRTIHDRKKQQNQDYKADKDEPKC
jgi:hypothetical protein